MLWSVFVYKRIDDYTWITPRFAQNAEPTRDEIESYKIMLWSIFVYKRIDDYTWFTPRFARNAEPTRNEIESYRSCYGLYLYIKEL